MGAQVLLDIVGSVIIGGLLLLTLQRFNNDNIANNYKYSGEMIVQKNLIEVVTQIEYDLRKIGYTNDYAHTIKRALAIVKADSSTIWFLTDLPRKKDNDYGDGIIDTVKYSLGPTSDLNNPYPNGQYNPHGTPNPYDRYLYRQVNNSAKTTSNIGVTRFRLTYYDLYDKLITTLPATMPAEIGYGIQTIMIDVSVENPAEYHNIYSKGKINLTTLIDTTDYSYTNRAMWKQIRLSARNYINR